MLAESKTMTTPTSDHVSLPEERTGEFTHLLSSETTYSVDAQPAGGKWQVGGK